ncbi:Neogenin, partial [Eumeta japonica]
IESEREQWQSAEGGVTELTVGGLRAGAEYGVRVAAAGGASSAELRVRTPPAAPAASPVNVTATPASATSILVRWDAPPTRTHRGPLTGYKIRYRAVNGPGAGMGTRRRAESLTTPADARRAELRGLERGTTYQVRVCALNANGSGPFSEWTTASTAPHDLDESAPPPQPPPLRTRAGRDWISVWWSAEGAGAGGVRVRGYSLGWGLGVPDEHSRDLSPHTHSYVIRDLQLNAEYVISLRASNNLGPGPPVYATVRTRTADEDDLGDVPDEDSNDDEGDDDDKDLEKAPPLIPPVGLKVIMLSGTTAVVYWTDPTLPRGQTATDGRRYVVRWAAAGSAGGRARTFNATDLNCMIDELKPFSTYEFAVKLIKGDRESAWSMLVSNTTLEATPSTPPRDLRVTAAPNAARAVELSWSPPLRPNGLITGYVVMYAAEKASATQDWAAVAVAGPRTSTRVDKLRARTTYLFKVQARNSKGLGPFSVPVRHTTAMEEGGGALAGATSAWLWASAGGACAVLALAAALALSLCCRRGTPPLSPDRSTYQKSAATAAIKPPDLWIHHDQMELKHIDKGLHGSAMSAGSVDGGGVGGGGPLMSSTLTLARAPPAEYESARVPPPHPHPGSVDRRHYAHTTSMVRIERRCESVDSDDTAVLRSSSASLPAPCCRRCDCPREHAPNPAHLLDLLQPMSSVGCAATCERRPHRPPLAAPDQNTPLIVGTVLASPQPSLASLQPLHPPPGPCGAGTCPLGAACGAPPTPAGLVAGAGSLSGGSDVYAVARERGHYVAYEPLGHYTHRDSMGSEAGGAGAAGSLHRRAGLVSGAGGVAPMHSFVLPSEHASSNHSTPSHGKGSVREASPYKRSGGSSPGASACGSGTNRLALGGAVPAAGDELEPLTPSRSTERLHREMANLEGLMKDLSAITGHHQFQC